MIRRAAKPAARRRRPCEARVMMWAPKSGDFGGVDRFAIRSATTLSFFCLALP
jgi:hypothetical protein